MSTTVTLDFAQPKRRISSFYTLYTAARVLLQLLYTYTSNDDSKNMLCSITNVCIAYFFFLRYTYHSTRTVSTCSRIPLFFRIVVELTLSIVTVHINNSQIDNRRKRSHIKNIKCYTIEKKARSVSRV